MSSSSGATTPGGDFAQTSSAGEARNPAVMSQEQMMAGLNARAGIRLRESNWVPPLPQRHSSAP